jgi:hypothetical protein
MKCHVVQRRLLALEDPHRPQAELRAHLARCPACRAWQRELVELEQRVPLLDVPPSDAKARLIERVLAGAVGPRREKPAGRPTLSLRTAGARRDVARRKVAAAMALLVPLAAAVLVMVVANWPSSSTPSPSSSPVVVNPLLGKLLKHDLSLARRTAKLDHRLNTLADMAGDLQGETKALVEAGGADDLKALADCYGQVLHEGIGQVGSSALAEERKAVAIQLWKAKGHLDDLAETVSEERGRQHLQSMAKAAEKAAQALEREVAHAGAPAPAGGWGLAFAGAPLARRGVLPASVPAALLAALSEARPPAAEPSSADRARSFGRDRGLIVQLVAGGVSLANQSDPLLRARCCNGLVKSLAAEIGKAARQREGTRVGELGLHLRSLLVDGVGENLSQARAHKRGSADEEAARKVENETDGFLTQLDRDLQGVERMEGLDKAQEAIHAWKDQREPTPEP